MKRATDVSGRSLRTLKVGEAMRHALADLLARGEVRDPALDGRIISVSEVRVTPDLRHATAYIIPVGGAPGDEVAVLAALSANVRQIRHALARAINTKYAADIHFRVDESYAESSRIEALLKNPRVKRDLESPPSAPLNPGDDEA